MRFARLLANEARFDGPNDIKVNGERAVQRVVLGSNAKRSDITIFDVGANRGEWSRSVFDQLNRNNGQHVVIHAFEPCPSTIQLLNASLHTLPPNAEVIIVDKALSNSTGFVSFKIVGDGSGVNSIVSSSEMDRHSRVENVEATTVDEYCRGASVFHIDLLKIDAEGHDLFVIEGAVGMLDGHKVDVIQFEYNHCWIKSRRFLRDAFEFFTPKGYRLGKVTPRGIEMYERWDFELETFREANYVAMLPSAASKFSLISWWNATSC